MKLCVNMYDKPSYLSETQHWRLIGKIKQALRGTPANCIKRVALNAEVNGLPPCLNRKKRGKCAGLSPLFQLAQPRYLMRGSAGVCLPPHFSSIIKHHGNSGRYMLSSS